MFNLKALATIVIVLIVIAIGVWEIRGHQLAADQQGAAMSADPAKVNTNDGKSY